MAPTPRRPHTATATATATAPAAPTSPHAKIQEALDARDALAGALTQAGIQLPAMDVRSPWPEDREGEARYALVHLGLCSAPVALLLADVILKGIAR